MSESADILATKIPQLLAIGDVDKLYNFLQTSPELLTDNADIMLQRFEEQFSNDWRDIRAKREILLLVKQIGIVNAFCCLRRVEGMPYDDEFWLSRDLLFAIQVWENCSDTEIQRVLPSAYVDLMKLKDVQHLDTDEQMMLAVAQVARAHPALYTPRAFAGLKRLKFEIKGDEILEVHVNKCIRIVEELAGSEIISYSREQQWKSDFSEGLNRLITAKSSNDIFNIMQLYRDVLTDVKAEEYFDRVISSLVESPATAILIEMHRIVLKFIRSKDNVHQFMDLVFSSDAAVELDSQNQVLAEQRKDLGYFLRVIWLYIDYLTKDDQEMRSLALKRVAALVTTLAPPDAIDYITVISRRIMSEKGPHEALVLVEKLLPIAIEAESPEHKLTAYIAYASTKSEIGDFDDALLKYQEAYKIVQQMNNPLFEAIVLGDIGSTYSYLSKPEKAKDYHTQALNLLIELNKIELCCGILFSLSLDYRQLGDRDNAFASLHRSLVLSKEFDDKALQGRIWDEIGDLHMHFGEFLQAGDSYRNSLKIFTELQDNTQIQVLSSKIEEASASSEMGELFSLATKVFSGQMPIGAAVTVAQSKLFAEKVETKKLIEIGLYWDHIDLDHSLAYTYAMLKWIFCQDEGIDKEARLACLVDLAIATKLTGNFALSREFFEKALNHEEQLQNQMVRAFLFEEYAHLGLLDSINLHLFEDYINSSLAIYEGVNATKRIISCYNRLGQFHQLQGDLEEAKNAYVNALDHCRRDPKAEVMVGMVLGNLSSVAIREGKLDEAEQLNLSAIRMFRQHNLQGDEARAAERFSLIQMLKDSTPEERESLISFMNSLAANDLANIRNTTEREQRFFTAAKLDDSGFLKDAAEKYGGIIAECEATEYDFYGVLSLWALAQNTMRQGKLDIATQLAQKFGEVLSTVKDKFSQEAFHGFNISYYKISGDIAISLGAYVLARHYLEKALELAEEIADKYSQLYILGSLSHVYASLGQISDEQRCLQSGLDLARVLDNKREIATYLLSIANNETNLDDALPIYQESLELYRLIGDKRGEGKVLDNLGIIMRRNERRDDAKTYHQQALDIAQEANYDDLAWRCLGALSLLEGESGHYQKAYDYSLQSINTLERLRRWTPTGMLRSLFLNDRDKLLAYELAIKYSIKINLLSKAFQHAEESRARSLAEQIHLSDLQPHNVPSEIWQKYVKMHESSISNRDELYIRSLSLGLLNTTEKHLAKQLPLIENKHRFQFQYLQPTEQVARDISVARSTLLDTIREFDPAFVDISHEKVVTVDNIVSEIAKNDVHCIVEFYVGESDTKVFIISPAVEGKNRNIEVLNVRSFHRFALNQILLGSGDGEMGWIRSQMEYSENPTLLSKSNLFDTIDRVCKQLHKLLLKPVIEYLKQYNYSRVSLVPHLGLALLPLHAAVLEAEHSEGEYFSDIFEVSYAPSSSILYRCYELLKVGKFDNRHFVGFSNPTSDLPFADVEVTSIATHFGTHQVVKHGQCTSDSFFTLSPTAGFLHFAGHGKYSFSNPMQSALFVMSKNGENHEKITLDDIFHKLTIPNTRMVVLSACQTGVYDSFDLASEFIGLSTGLIKAGSPCVLSSLWQVNDFSTSLLMERFYDLILNGDKDILPVTALRRSQVWLRSLKNKDLVQLMMDRSLTIREIIQKDRIVLTDKQASNLYMKFALSDPNATPFDHPFYWAPFVINGV